MNDTMWPPMGRTAHLSLDGDYRYQLTRRWATGPYVCFIMLNPSKADATIDDQTIRKCMALTRRWRMGAIVVVNLYAFRATDPKELVRCEHPMGPYNDEVIHDSCVRARAIVAGWGNTSAGAYHHARVKQVLDLLDSIGRPVYCLGRCKDGSPRHPLYVPASSTPVEFITPRGA